MKALVTGGAGFIGSALVRSLIADGWDVLVLDNLSSGNRQNLPPEARYRWFDLGADDAQYSLPNETFDAVFHLASHVGQELSFERPVYDLKSNALSTVSLLNWCAKGACKRFVFASTMNVYGEPAQLPVTELTPVATPSPYAVAKIASENFCKVYESFGIESTCLRLFNVYGPGQDMKNMKQGMVSIFMTYMALGKRIVVRGSGDRFRDFIYVGDVVEAFKAALQPAAVGRTYNVASGKKTTVSELLNQMSRAFGHAEGTYPVEFREGTPNDQFGVYGDSTKLQQELGWRPQVALPEGLDRMARWARELPPTVFAKV